MNKFYKKVLIWGIGVGIGSGVIKHIFQHRINSQFTNLELSGDLIARFVFFKIFICIFDTLFKRKQWEKK